MKSLRRELPITHTSTMGRVLVVEKPTPEIRAFLARLERMVDDEHKTERDMIALAYSRQNPILEAHPIFPGGWVTPKVLTLPAYGIVTDLLFRKRVVAERIDVSVLAAEYTLTVREAAAKLGITETAVRKAIQDQRLPAWVKGRRTFLHPRSVAAFKVGSQGPKAARVRRERRKKGA